MVFGHFLIETYCTVSIVEIYIYIINIAGKLSSHLSALEKPFTVLHTVNNMKMVSLKYLLVKEHLNVQKIWIHSQRNILISAISNLKMSI